jgi:hypothetical protein
LWDSHADVIKAANNTLETVAGLTARMRVFSLDGKDIYSKSAAVDLKPSSVADVFPFQRPPAEAAVFFVKLTLEKASQTVSENFYWSSVDGISCQALNTLPIVALTARARRSQAGEILHFTVNLSNATQTVAPAVRLKVQRAASGQRVLPVFYSDNYFGLLPGESKTVSLEFPQASLAGEAPRVMLEGWNIRPQDVLA